MFMKFALAFAPLVAASGFEEVQTVYHARRRSLLNKHRHKHQDHVELLSTATASFKQAPSSDDESNVRVINDPESNQVTFEVQELNPDYTSHTAHIEDSEELDSARASASHDLNAAGETVEAGVDADMTEEAEEPTRLDMEVRDARRMVAARQAGQLGTDAPVVQMRIENGVAQPVATNAALLSEEEKRRAVETMDSHIMGLKHQQRGDNAVQKAHAKTALSQTASATAAKTTVAGPSAGNRPKGWDQCLKFARMTKAQGVQGNELVRTWKTTCEPAVESGVATERYKLMCNSLGGAVEPFAAQHDYDVMQLCDAVMTVFHDVLAQ